MLSLISKMAWNIFYIHCQVVIPILTTISSSFLFYHGWKLPYKKRKFSTILHRFSGLFMIAIPLINIVLELSAIKLTAAEIYIQLTIMVLCCVSCLPLLSHLPKTTSRIHRFFAIGIGFQIGVAASNSMIAWIAYIDLQLPTWLWWIFTIGVAAPFMYCVAAVMLDFMDVILVWIFGPAHAPHKILSDKFFSNE